MQTGTGLEQEKEKIRSGKKVRPIPDYGKGYDTNQVEIILQLTFSAFLF